MFFFLDPMYYLVVVLKARPDVVCARPLKVQREINLNRSTSYKINVFYFGISNLQKLKVTWGIVRFCTSIFVVDFDFSFTLSNLLSTLHGS